MNNVSDFKGLNVLSEVITTVSIIGEEETIKALTNARVQSSRQFQNESKHIILKVVGAEYNLPIGYLNEKSGSIKDDRVIALAFCCYFLKKHLNYSLSDLMLWSGRHRNCVWKYDNLIKNFHPEIDKKTIVRKIKMDEEITKAINNLKIETNGKEK